MMHYIKRTIAICSFLLIASCSHYSPETLRDRADAFMVEQNGFTRHLVKGDQFILTSYQKITNKEAPTIFYVEGDGHTFESYGMPAVNPTPWGMITMKLAALDNSENIVYIARPCQLTPMELNPVCNKFYWIRGRMSKKTVISMAQAINKIAGQNKIKLVGFSGGGGMVVLMSALGLVKPESIITLAGNLDHVAFTNYHQNRTNRNLIPLSDSLNPIDFVSKISMIPQLHLSGGQDEIVPAHIAQKFTHKAASSCVKHKIYANPTHSKMWEQYWLQILEIPLDCN